LYHKKKGDDRNFSAEQRQSLYWEEVKISDTETEEKSETEDNS